MSPIIDGTNARIPITPIRYFIGLCILHFFHLKCYCGVLLSHVFKNKLPNMQQIHQFHSLYFADLKNDLKKQNGITYKK